MENVKTTNLISTSNISGNVGSCETKTTNAQTGNTFWTEQYTTVFTNSCTGQVINTQTYTTYNGVCLFIAIPIIFLIILICMFVRKIVELNDNKKYFLGD